MLIVLTLSFVSSHDEQLVLPTDKRGWEVQRNQEAIMSLLGNNEEKKKLEVYLPVCEQHMSPEYIYIYMYIYEHEARRGERHLVQLVELNRRLTATCSL